MLVRFWGTRGSLPVAPTADTIRQKVVRAVMAANGKRFADAAEAESFVSEEHLTRIQREAQELVTGVLTNA